MTVGSVFGGHLCPSRRSVLCLEMLGHPLIVVACIAQLLDVLQSDVLVVLRSFCNQLKARCLSVRQLPLAALFLPLEVLDKVHDNPCDVFSDACHTELFTLQKFSNAAVSPVGL